MRKSMRILCLASAALIIAAVAFFAQPKRLLLEAGEAEPVVILAMEAENADSGAPGSGATWSSDKSMISNPLFMNADMGLGYANLIVPYANQFTSPTDITPLSYSCTTGTGGSVQLSTSGGDPSAATFTPANPRAGVTLSADGKLTVASTLAAGTYKFDITADNTIGAVTKEFTLTVEPVKTTSSSTTAKSTSTPESLPTGVKIGLKEGDTYPTITRTFTGGGSDNKLAASITSSQVGEMMKLATEATEILKRFDHSTLEFIWNTDAERIEISIDAETLKIMANGNVDKFFVQTGLYQFAFDNDALLTLGLKGDVTIIIEPYEPGEEETAVGQTSGIRKVARVTVMAGGEEISALSCGRMYGAIRYQLGRGDKRDSLFACAVNQEGNPAWINTSGYSAGYVAWNTIGASGVYGLGMTNMSRGMDTSTEGLWIGPASAPVAPNLPVFGS